MECLSSLVGVRELCTENKVQPLFYLDMAEGIDRLALSQLAKASNGSGKAFGNEIIESASRFLMADIETLIPKGYSIKSSLNSFCNTCTYTGVTSTAAKTGIVVKNISTSKNAFLSIDSLKVMIQSTGTFNIVLDDGIAPRRIEHDFTAGTEVSIVNISYKTSASSIKIYFLEPGVIIPALSCPVLKSGCCGGSSSLQSTDLQVKGLLNDIEFTTQYSFTPCASIVCSLDNIICSIINQQPKLFALTLFYRAVARYFSEFQVTERNNRNASFNEDQKRSLADRYIELYYERLRGSGNVKGISDNMKAALDNLNDSCIECKRITGISWGAG